MQQQELEIVLSYSRRDEQIANELEQYLSTLKVQNPSIYIWSRANILPGQVQEQAIREHLKSARLILLLVSPDFIADNMINNDLQIIEERRDAGTALVLLILARPTFLRDTFLANLQILPTNGKPLSKWRSRDLAYLEIIDAIKIAIATLQSPAQADDEKKQLRKSLETFSEQDLLTLSFDLRLNILALLENPTEKGGARSPKVNVDRLLRYMEQQGRTQDLADYVRTNRPALNENRGAT